MSTIELTQEQFRNIVYEDYYYSYEDGGVTLTEVQKVKKVIETEVWEIV